MARQGRPRIRRGRRRRGRRIRRWRSRGLAIGLVAAGLAAFYLWWSPSPPQNPDDLCSIFAEKRSWYRSARSSYETWGVPEAVQLAVIHQESGFRAHARPPRRKFLWILPGRRWSSAYGYTQAIDATWQEFRDKSGRSDADRHRFADAAHFVGWYGGEIHRLTGIAKDDAYRLYLAYHEGPAGYSRGSHQAKPWLLATARRVAERARIYQRQYDGCAGSLRRQELWRRVKLAGLLVLAALAGWGLWRYRRRRKKPRAVR